MQRLLFILAALGPSLAVAQAIPLTAASPQTKVAFDAYGACFLAAGKQMLYNRIDPSDVLARAASEMCEEQLDGVRRAVQDENRQSLAAEAFAVAKAAEMRQLFIATFTINIAKVRALHPR